MSDSARIGVLVSALFIAVFSGPATVSAAQELAWKAQQVELTKALVQTGLASYYSGHGRKASGKNHKSGLTAAHRTLPFGTTCTTGPFARQLRRASPAFRPGL
jgi:rare lipoprotein A (peptidoglycan hydrolase)